MEKLNPQRRNPKDTGEDQHLEIQNSHRQASRGFVPGRPRKPGRPGELNIGLHQ